MRAGRAAAAIVGAWILGAVIPALVISLAAPRESSLLRRGEMFIFGLLSASLGVIILGYVAFEFFRKAAAQSNEAKYQAYEGMLIGGMVFALNVPAYVPVLFTGLLHVFVMLVVSGTWCGAWISWQAWSTEHPEHRFAPQFSLATLLVYIFGIASVLAVFMQR